MGAKISGNAYRGIGHSVALEPDLALVTNHAVIRYVQRIVLGVSRDMEFVDEDFRPLDDLYARERAEALCAVTGLDIDDVRRSLLTPAVLAALQLGALRVIGDRFTVGISSNGTSRRVVTTVLPRWPRQHHSSLLDRREHQSRHTRKRLAMLEAMER